MQVARTFGRIYQAAPTKHLPNGNKVISLFSPRESNMNTSLFNGNDVIQPLEAVGKNSRRPKKANHGARPCSSYMRKRKKIRRSRISNKD